MIKKKIRNRSHSFEYILGHYFQSSVKKAVILAGGKGSKLRPYTYEIPTSLLPIKGKPILEYLIENLKANNIFDIIICTGYLGDKIKNYFGTGERFGVRISYSEEKEPLKTGGALLKAKEFLENQPFILLHGDILTNLSLKDIIAFHEKEKPIATVALTSVEKPENFGQLKIHGNTLVNFYQGHKAQSHLINSGIYVFEPQIFDAFPHHTLKFHLEDSIEQLIEQKRVNGFVFESQWFDVGSPQNYERAIKEFIKSPVPSQK